MTNDLPQKPPPLPRDDKRNIVIRNDEELGMVLERRDYYMAQCSDLTLNWVTRGQCYNRAQHLNSVMTEYIDRRNATALQAKLRTKVQEARVSLITNHTPDGITVEITDAKAFEASALEVERLYGTMQNKPAAEHLAILSKVSAHLDAQKAYLTLPKPDVEALQSFATFLIDYYTRPAADVNRDHPVWAKESDEIARLHSKWESTCQRVDRIVEPPYDWPTPDNWDEAFILWFILPTLKKIMGRA